jgi:replicative DNA helicase
MAKDAPIERMPPQNIEAEQSVLGSMILVNDCIHDVVQMLTSECFFRDSHQKMYAAIESLYRDGKNIDSLILREELKKRGQLEPVGKGELTSEYLGTVLETVPSAAHAVYYARIVREKAVARRLIGAANEILRDAFEATDSGDELLQKAERSIFDIAQNRMVSETHSLSEVLAEAFDRIDDRASRGGHVISGIPTGFLELDDLTSGLQDSELIILAARPSVGKTALAMNIAEHVAVDQNIGVFVASLEQSKLELAERMLCSRARLDGHKLRTGRLSAADVAKLQDAAGELKPAPLFIDDTPGRTILQIAANARRLKRQHNIRLIVIDYLQLIEPDDRGDSRQDQVSQISRRLKMLARDLKVPVITLSQLNRSPEMREGHRPRMADLRESGSIEQDADVVMLLHRPDMYDKQAPPGSAEVIIAKQRNGPTGEIKLTFLKHYTRFENFSDQMAPGDAPPRSHSGGNGDNPWD